MGEAVPIGSDPLAGRLVRLRELRDDDLPTLTGWWSDPAVATYQNSGPVHPRPQPSVADMLKKWSSNDGNDVALVVTTMDGDEVAGHAALHSIGLKDRCASLGIMMGPAFQRRGLGTDATRVLLRYGFTELGLHRVQLEVFSYNARAIASYRKAGFVEEGRRRQSLFRSGQWHDEVLMSLLRCEWTD